MAQYILKDALVAEINKRIIDAPINSIGNQRVWAYNDVKYIINSLEVKEVDLEKKIDKVWDTDYEDFGISADNFYRVAKHFFELGLKAAQKGE